MLIDKVKIKIASGKGGRGAITWRKEKFIAFGGPDGGDGGKGGSVYLEATEDMNTLLDFRYNALYQADKGQNGAKKNCHGKKGEDLIIKVPCGTVVSDPEADITIADLVNVGDRALVAEGGRGGKGNAKFKSNKNRVPHICEPGDPGIERELVLELKMIATAGIIGFPNAGKSTLISKISAAKPKIADYAFTTLEPNLGVVHKDSGEGFVVADIPGLIEGASEGVGLGHEFLRHIERTKLLVHMIDVWGNDSGLALDNYHKLNQELAKYKDTLIKKPQILVLNKVEGYPKEDLEKLIKDFEEAIAQEKEIETLGFFQIAAFTGDGVEEFKEFLCKQVEELPEILEKVQIDYDPVADDHDDSAYSIHQASPTFWNVYCGKLERLMRVTDLRERESLSHLFRVAKSMGVFEELIKKGAQPGHSLDIDGVEFELTEANLIAENTPQD